MSSVIKETVYSSLSLDMSDQWQYTAAVISGPACPVSL